MNLALKLFLCVNICLTSMSLHAYCKDDINLTKPDSRYSLISNGTEVLDKKTNLIWQRCHIGTKWNGETCEAVKGKSTTYIWKDALIESKKLGSNYRLPNIKELESLAERSCSPMLNPNIFPMVPRKSYSRWAHQYSPFWSSSVSSGGNYWYDFLDFGVSNTARFYKNESYFVRPVRENK